MRIIITTLILLNFISLFGQDCTEPVCIYIKGLLDSIERQEQKLKNMQKEAEANYDNYKKEREKGQKSKERADFFEDAYNKIREREYELIKEIVRLNSELDVKYKEAENSDRKSKELMNFLEKRNKKLEEEKKTIETELIAYQQDANHLAKMNAWIYDFDVCYLKNGECKCVKVDGLPVSPTFKKLDRIDYQGNYLYYVKNKEDAPAEIPGKTILYIDNDYFAEFNDTLEIQNTVLNKYAYYNYSSGRCRVLPTSLPDGKLIRLAFIEEKNLAKTNSLDYKSFWIAFKQGLFSISTIKFLPRYDFELTTKVDGRETEVVQEISLKKSVISITLNDYGKEDGDIISLKLNDTWILEDYRITKKTKPITLILTQKSNYLILYSVNQGKIGTCTANLTIVAGEERQAIQLNSDSKRSQVLRINLDE